MLSLLMVTILSKQPAECHIMIRTKTLSTLFRRQRMVGRPSGTTNKGDPGLNALY